MSRDDIVRMAQEVESEVGFKWCVNFIELERFAAMVAAAEREACAQVCEELAETEWADNERCAAAIRARGQS